jgi:membrane protease YdiL (CAAX protease family)
MAPAQPWKTEAVFRLLLSVILCAFAGSLVMAVIHFAGPGGTKAAKFYPAAFLALGCLGFALALAQRPWTLENFLSRAIWLLACFYAGLFLGFWVLQTSWPDKAALPTQGQMLAAILSFQGSSLVLGWLFLREHQLGWSDAFGLRRGKARAVAMGAIAACLFLPLGSHLERASGSLLKWGARQLSPLLPRLENYQPEEQKSVQTLRTADSWSSRLLLGLATILVAPAAEEVLFRGVLYPWLKRRWGTTLALLLASAAFAFMHLNLVTFLPLFVLALILTFLYEWTNNLLAAITAHSLFNALNFAVLYLYERQNLSS